jgi:hypothetical protein
MLPLLLSALLSAPAQARRPATGAELTVPSVDEVVAREGFTPVPSQSEIYAPGTVLVPNAQGSHDVVVNRCIDADPRVAIISQSSIATTLAGGVSARLSVARGEASAAVEKRLSFVDPEQRTIALGDLVPTDDCLARVHRAAGLYDLEQAVVVHDVLVAVVKSSVCIRGDAQGSIVALGAAEASAYAECVQESPGQVPLGFKAVPLRKVMATAPPAQSPPTSSASQPTASAQGLASPPGPTGPEVRVQVDRVCHPTSKTCVNVRNDSIYPMEITAVE